MYTGEGDKHMIEIKKLSKCFGEKAALNEVTLTVEDGRILGLVGSNGAGKSTLLRCVNGIYSADGGEVLVDGAPVFESPETKGRISFVPDTPNFEPGATLESTARLMESFYPRFSREKYERLLNTFPLKPEMKIHAMSKGMQRQAVLIAALSTVPDYLLLDEVFDGLDPVMRRLLKRVIAGEVADRGMTVLIASHNLRELEDFCDTVGLLHSGGVLLEKEIDALRLGLHRVQVVFNEMQDDASLAAGLDLLSVSRTGALCTLVARGERESLEKTLADYGYTFCEFLPLSLEEVFISEMEAVGYDFENILC